MVAIRRDEHDVDVCLHLEDEVLVLMDGSVVQDEARELGRERRAVGADCHHHLINTGLLAMRGAGWHSARG